MYPKSNSGKYTAEEYKKFANKPTVSSNQLVSFVSYLQGRVLTVIDASIADHVQNKALKNIMKTALWDGYGILSDWCIENAGEGGSTFPFYQPPSEAGIEPSGE